LSFSIKQFEGRLEGVVTDEEEKEKLIEGFKRKEIDFLNLKRIKMSIDDFKTIKLIGKGAFGIVTKTKTKTETSKHYNSYFCRWNWYRKRITERFTH
jgi:protein-serine/threonine kinase